MTVNFYNFTKRSNSTKRPVGDPSLTVDATMREDCSIFSPKMSLHKTAAINTRTLNYVYIPAFDRYYFVRDWTWSEGLWIVSMYEDPLASWKDTIGASSEYVVRSSAEFDGRIRDNIYPITCNIQKTHQQFTSPFANYASEANSSFVVAVIGETNTTTYYAMTATQYRLFVKGLFSDDFLDSIVPNASTNFPELKIQLNPINYVKSVRQFPFVIPSGNLGAAVNDIHVGFGVVSFPGTIAQVIEQPLYRTTITATIDKHPQAAIRGAYMNSDPFTQYNLFFPPFGSIPLEGDTLIDSTQIAMDCCVDLYTGNAYLTITNEALSPAHVLAWVSAKASKELTLAQVQAPGYGVGATVKAVAEGVSIAAGGVSSAFSSINPVAMGASIAQSAAEATKFAVDTVGDVARSKIPTLTTVGSDGGTVTFYGDCHLTAFFYMAAADDNAQRGRPLCQIRQISTIPGFIVVDDPDFSCNGTAEEIDAIKSFMASGFFYE